MITVIPSWNKNRRTITIWKWLPEIGGLIRYTINHDYDILAVWAFVGRAPAEDTRDCEANDNAESVT